MKSKNYRIFELDGAKYSFNPVGFRQAVSTYQQKLKENGKPYLMKDISDELASELSISTEALDNWRKGYNGPADIELIKKSASVLQCDYRELLEHQGGHKNMINKEVSYEYSSTESEALRSVLGDLQEIVECYGKTNGFNDWKINKTEQNPDGEDVDVEGWFESIRIKMRKSEYSISRENMGKLENLFMETKCFVDYSFHGILRWKNICKGFQLQRIIDDDIVFDDALDVDTLLCNTDYLDEDMLKYLSEEIDGYIQGRISYDNPIEVIGYRIGAWYLEIIRNDFPALFVD